MCLKKKKNIEWYSSARKKKKISKKTAFVILSIVVVLMLLAGVVLYLFDRFYSPWEPFETDKETLNKLAPINEAQVNAIDSIPQYGAGEKWAVYIYMVGSDLESNGIDELSDLTKVVIKDEAEANLREKEQTSGERISRFVHEVESKGVSLPSILFSPSVPVNTESTAADSYNPDSEGAASSDIFEMLSAEIPADTNIVIQTGGAKRWQNARINPNRSQRFVIDSYGMTEIYNEPIVNMANPESLKKFVKFCYENYPAEHRMLILWNHGGGIAGYGSDEIFSYDTLTINEIKLALSEAVKPDFTKPPFEIIGFDACLMASSEVANQLKGLGKYLIGSEEVEPGAGWDYAGWLNALSSEPQMNADKLGRIIADTFIEASISEFADDGYVTPVTFSLIDINAAAKAYSDYSDFCSSALEKVKNDPGYLANLSRAAQASTAYGSSTYRVNNTIDLGQFMEETMDISPGQAKKVLDAVNKSVLYVRSSSYLTDSKGLSVYFPARIEGKGGLSFFLDFLENGICSSHDVKALYYYKLAGCLNDELNGYIKLPNIDYSKMNSVSSKDVSCDGNGNLSLKLDKNEMSLTQDVRLGLAKYDSENGDITYYGEDVYAFLDSDGKISSSFDGKWITLGGHPLQLEVVSKTGDDVTFRTKIVYNSLDAWLMTGYNAETGKLSILGIREDINAAGLSDRNLLIPKKGDMIILKYDAGNLNSNASKVLKEIVIFGPNTKLESKKLKNGTYFEYIVIEDLRSDTYTSQIVSFSIDKGKISDQKVDNTVFSYNKE